MEVTSADHWCSQVDITGVKINPLFYPGYHPDQSRIRRDSPEVLAQHPFLKPARYLSFKELVTFKYQLALVPVTGPHSVLVSRSPGVSYFSVREFVNEFTTSKKWFTYCFTPRLLPEQTPHNDSILPGGTFFIQLFSCNLQFVPKATIGRNEWRKSISSVFLPFLCLLIKSFSNFYQRALFDSK